MLAVIFTIVFAIGVAFFATLNTALVTINIPGYSVSVPLYLLVLISILTGFVFAWLLHLMNAFTSLFALRDKNSIIRKEKKVNSELTKKVNDLEIEKTKLEKEKESGFNQ